MDIERYHTNYSLLGHQKKCRYMSTSLYLEDDTYLPFIQFHPYFSVMFPVTLLYYYSFLNL